MNTRRTFFILLAGIAFCVTGRSQQGQPDLDEPLKRTVIDEISTRLRENYVFPDVAERCAEHLAARLRAGAFNSIAAPDSFAKALTDDLQSISHDKHMRVRVRPRAPDGPSPGPPNPILEPYLQLRELAADNYGFRKLEILEGNVGYVDLTMFPPVELARDTAVAAMKFLSNADAIIVDERNNGGGNPSTIQLICSYFFDSRTHLNSLYWRRGDRTEEFWTLDSVEGRKMPDVPLFVLTSHRTFSGGEEFAYNLKTRKRATIIGEVTGGGANPGGGFPLPGGLGIFIPTGRAINPVTKTNWEGTGVEPDIKTNASDALAVALEKARAAAKAYREAREARMREAADQLGRRMQEAESAIKGGDALKAAALVDAILESGVEQNVLSEQAINNLGYSYLQKDQPKFAIAVFAYNVKKYPKSANVYDSLGEAYLKDGQRERAREMYRKSLELDPANENARSTIEKIGTSRTGSDQVK